MAAQYTPRAFSFVNFLGLAGVVCFLLLPRAVVAAPTNTDFVQQAYRDLLLREADPAALMSFVPALDSAAQTRLQVATALVNSTEYRARRINEFYSDFLGRTPSSAELTGAVNFLGTNRIEQARAVILDSSEYFVTQGGGTNAGFLDALFLDLLNRPIDPTASATFQAQLASGTVFRRDIALAVQSSSEWYGIIVDEYYRQFLRRPADAAGISVFSNYLQTGGTEQLLSASLVASDEYFQRLPEPSALALLPFAAMLFFRRPGRF